MVTKKQKNIFENENTNSFEKIIQANAILLGDRKTLFYDFKEKLEEKFGGEVTLFEIEKMNISVDEIRYVKDFSNKTSEFPKIILISSFYWNEGSQNALLKLTEETPENTKIFLFGLSKDFFLNTILSRIQKYEFKNTNRYLELAEEILALPRNKRLNEKRVSKILDMKVEEGKYGEDDTSSKKDRESHILFLEALILKILEKKENTNKDFLEMINKIANHIYDPGASPHLFIEWLLLAY